MTAGLVWPRPAKAYDPITLDLRNPWNHIESPGGEWRESRASGVRDGGGEDLRDQGAEQEAARGADGGADEPDHQPEAAVAPGGGGQSEGGRGGTTCGGASRRACSAPSLDDEVDAVRRRC